MSDIGPGADRPDEPAPTTHLPWQPSVDVLATEPDEPAGRRAAPWALVGGAAVLVLALVGGVTYAVGALSGGGSQPADALPAGAFAVVSVDLDPSVGQKLDGFRFVRKFPALRDHVPADGDVREVLFDAAAEQAGWTGIDYDSQVAPWLGKRVAVAAYPAPDGKQAGVPTTVVALQITDAGQAETGLQRLTAAAAHGAAAGSVPGFVIAGDYALLAETPALARTMADRAESAPLSADTDFATDVATAGDGVAVAWVDMGRAGRGLGADGMLLGPAGGLLGAAGGAGGRSTFVARFDGPDVFEVVGHVTGVSGAGWATHPVRGMAELPATSVAAVGLADGNVLVTKAYTAMRARLTAQGADPETMVAQAQRSLGVRLPDDLAVLLGDNLVAALDGGGTGRGVQVGVRVTTDVPAAQGVLDKLEAAAHGMGADVPVVRRAAGSDLVVASTARQATLLSRRGTLGDVPAFTRSLPDLAGADLAVWVDPAQLASAVLGTDTLDANLEPIDGLGVTVSSGSSDGAGAATYRLRLVAH